jgi:hypothetical protein
MAWLLMMSVRLSQPQDRNYGIGNDFAFSTRPTPLASGGYLCRMAGNQIVSPLVIVINGLSNVGL